MKELLERLGKSIEDIRENLESFLLRHPEYEDKSETDFLYLNAISHLELARNTLRLATIAAHKEDRQRFKEALEGEYDEY